LDSEATYMISQGLKSRILFSVGLICYVSLSSIGFDVASISLNIFEL